jgi:hypothetical protein
MLSVAQDLVSQLQPYQQSLDTALAAATSLPLVGKQLAGSQEFTTIFQSALSQIDSSTQSLPPTGHYQLTVPLDSISKTFSFDLGLDAFLKATAVGNVHAAINPALTVSFDLQNGAATLDAADSGLDLNFDLTLPGFTGTFSFDRFLFTQACDAGTDFHGDLGFGFDASGDVAPRFSGDAKVLNYYRLEAGRLKENRELRTGSPSLTIW